MASALQRLLTLHFVIVFVSHVSRSDPASDSRPPLTSRTVRTKYGDVSGVIMTLESKHLEPVEVFRGIPYASPPLGSLRFMPPVTGALWQGVKIADKFSPVCPQRLPDIANETAALRRMPKGRLEYLKRLLPHLKEQSEDCLYLNIYAPAQGSAQDRLRWNRKFGLTIPSREQWEGNTVELRPEGLVCYTDGSRLTDKQASGAGIYLEGRDIRESYALGRYTTVFQAEVYAILTVATRQEVKEGPEQKIYICSDSQAALKAICHPRPSSVLVQECGDSLEKLAETKEVELVWVPGHRGVPGNEVVDELAGSVPLRRSVDRSQY